MKKWAICLLLYCFVSQGFSRTWSNSEGTELEAELVSVDGDSVVLMGDNGQSKRLKISVFSDQDQFYIESQRDEESPDEGLTPEDLESGGSEEASGGALSIFEEWKNKFPALPADFMANGFTFIGVVIGFVVLVIVFWIHIVVIKRAGRWAGMQISGSGAVLIIIVSWVVSIIFNIGMTFAQAFLPEAASMVLAVLSIFLPLIFAYAGVGNGSAGQAILATVYYCLIWIAIAVVVGGGLFLVSLLLGG